MEGKEELVLYSEKEADLDREATSIEEAASSFVIANDTDFASAGDFARNVKSVQKKVEEYWEPMRESTYKAYKAVTDHKKEMLVPLKNAEKIMKNKMSDYKMRQEKLRKEQEDKLRMLAREELDKKLAEAAKAESEGNAFDAEFAMAEAEVLDNLTQTATVAAKSVKAKGISTSKAWAIKNIDLSKLPAEFAGVLIRPADEKAIMKLIKATNGKIQIPGVEYEETVSISVRAS